MHPISALRSTAPTLAMIAVTMAGAARAELSPEWVARLPIGSSLSAGLYGMAVDAAGVSYVTGTSGSSSNTDITTAAFRPDGSLLWSRTFNGPADWHDQARGITLGTDGVVYVTGNTPGPGSYANVLLLAYDAASGALLDSVQYSSGPFTAEHGASVAADGDGNVYIGGGTVGDGGDALIVKLDPNGELVWRRTWDGPAFGPYSQDNALEVLLDANGDLLVMIHGVMSSNHPDYVVVKYDPANGATIWDENWGVDGGDFPTDLEIDAQGDVYVTGTGIDFNDKYSTIKLRGDDGDLIWQAYDAGGVDDSAYALALDGDGGVLVTGRVDPDGDRSNFNDNIYTVKRDAADGTLAWTHRYGADCLYCFDMPSDVIADPDGHVFVAGSTSSPPYSGDVILLVLDNATGLESDRGIVFGGGNESAGSGILRFDAAFNLFDGGQLYNVNTGEVDMSVTKWTSLVAGIACGDLLGLQTRCAAATTGNMMQIRVTLTGDDHAGEQVTVSIDGKPQVLTVSGNRAQGVIPGAEPGPHTVELTDPAGCFPPQVPTCPGS